MKLSREGAGAAYFIRAYAEGRVTVNEEVLTCSVVVTPERLLRDWPPETFEELAEADIDYLIGLDPEIVVLGTGRGQRFPAGHLLARLQGRGIGVEVMDTGAACRTFNILCAEGRRVAAALLMI